MRYLIFMFALTIFSCQSNPKITEIDIRIENAKAEEAVITGFNYKKSLDLVEGNAKDTLTIKQAGIYNLRVGRNGTKVYLKPGDKLQFSAKESEFADTYQVVGPNDKIQSYLRNKTRIKNKLLAGREIFKMDADNYSSRMEEANDSLKIAIKTANLPTDFANAELANMDLLKQRMKFIFPTYTDQKIEDLGKYYQNPLEGISLSQEDLYQSSEEYRELVNDQFSLTIYQDTSAEYEEVFMNNIAKVKAGNIKDQLLYKDMRYMMGPNESLNSKFEFFKKHSNNSSHLAIMQENYNELQKLKKGAESPEFDYENHKGGNTSLDDLEGKYVYVDVWATWCGPCKAEIPHLKEIEKKYHDSNIEFVSISIDNPKDYEKWKNMVNDKELGGFQLFADNAWESQFVTEYMIKGIPRFILIDPNGKIVSAEAPRPSDEKLEKTFENLAI